MTTTRTKFETLVKKAIKEYGENYIDISEEMLEEHEFSEKFERKMQKLIKKNFYFVLKKVPMRRVITLLLTALLALFTISMGASSTRNEVPGFFTHKFKTHTEVHVEKGESYTKYLEELYEITELPEGYTLTNIDKNSMLYDLTYTTDDGMRLLFSQRSKYKYTTSVNTEGHEIEPVMIDGNYGFLVETDFSCILIWANDDYVFEVFIDSGKYGEYTRKIAFRIANSVQKVENS